MATAPNKLSSFWKDLKRRNVVRVITVYTGAAFVILSLVDMIREPFELPNWSFKLVVVILSIGLIIAVILSWIYDIHPEGGIIKTEPSDKIKPEEHPGSSTGWKIASYISFVVILGLIALNIFGGKKGPRIDESLSKSVAVLVFNNYSGDPGQDYMCIGLSDEIINNLYKMASFDEVRPLNSVKPFRDSELSPQEIAQILQVNYLLIGTYKRMGDALKITAQLFEAKSVNPIRSYEYDLPYIKIMGIPGDIALQIASNLKAFISEDVKQSIDRNSTDNLEVYEIGKQIMALYNRAMAEFTNSYNDKIKELAEDAIALDPGYADAYSMLGTMTLFEGIYRGSKEMRTVAWDAKLYYEKALEHDSYNLMANAGLALISYWAERDYIKLEEFALEFPDFLSSDANYMNGYTMFNTAMGNFERVVSIPESDYFDDNVVRAYILLGKEDKAWELLKSAIVEQANYPSVGELFIWLQEFDTALYYLDSAFNSGSALMNTPRYLADLALACLKTGRTERARKIIGTLMELSDTTAVGSPAYFVGWYYGWTGELDSAFYWLERAMENRSPEIPWLKEDPAFKSLKDDPRYSDLYVRAGFKSYVDYMASRKE